MHTWRAAPADELTDVVDCYWHLDRTASNNRANYPILNPDTHAHLILAAEQQPYDYQATPGRFVGCGSHLIFPHNQRLLLDHSSPLTITGVKFKPGALYALGLTAYDADINTVIPFTNPYTEHTQQDDICQQLNHWLQPWIADAKKDRHYDLAMATLALLPTAPIALMGERLLRPQRSVERAFLRVTGFSMRQFVSIERLDMMLESLYQEKDHAINWSDVAARFGFSDQPHLVRHFKTIFGKTPGEYARQRDLTIDIYGDFSETDK